MWDWGRLPSGSYLCFKTWDAALELIRELLPPSSSSPAHEMASELRSEGTMAIPEPLVLSRPRKTNMWLSEG